MKAKMQIIIILMFILVVGASACAPRTSDYAQGVVVSTSTTHDGRFGIVLFTLDGKFRAGSLMALSTGAEGEGFRQCDTVRLKCNYQDPTRCRGVQVINKFVGTADECQAHLLERGIISR